MFDAVLSLSVLGSAIIYLLSDVSLEAYVGAIISIVIIKSGVEMMSETLDEILGVRADKETTNEIKKLICEEPEIQGAYDLFVYNYGPDKNYASVHIEVPDTMTAKEIDKLTRKIEVKVYQKTGVILAGVGVYSYNTSDNEAAKLQNDIRKRVLAHDWAMQVHGFYVENKNIRFDVVMSFDINYKEGLKIIYDEMNKSYPEYNFQIAPDVDVSD